MSQQIKFTSFGIPRILEFENVSFVPTVHPPECPPISPSSSSSSFCYIESPPPPSRPHLFSLPSASSLFKRKPRPSGLTIAEPPEPTKPLPSPPPSDVPETNGIYIQFHPEHSHSHLTRKKRLVHLQKAISIAVLDAGMSSSPGNTTHPENHSTDDAVRQPRRQKTTDALFCGTYGQMMAALEAAGLSVTPCVDDGLSGYTRLGALFVARNDGINGLQLRNITLWG